MAEETVKNPFVEMFAQWEKAMAENFDALLRNPAFIASMGKVLESSLDFKKQIDESIQSYLHAMNLASTKDIDKVWKEIALLKLQVDELKGKLGVLLQRSASSSE